MIDMLHDYKLKSAILAFLSGAPVRAGFAWGFREALFNRSVRRKEQLNKNMAQLNSELLKSLEVPVKVETPRISLRAQQQRDKALVIIHPGGYYASQRWDAENFALLGKRLLEKPEIDLLIMGGSQDRSLVNHLVLKLGNKNVKTEFPGMKDLVLLLSKCNLLVCNNSGPLHLAAALGVPTVSMMGPTDPALWWPIGDNHIVLRKNLSCSPCSRGICNKHDCMKLITVDEAMQAVEAQIKKIQNDIKMPLSKTNFNS